MKKLSKKSVLLFAGVLSVCAFMVPSMASAAGFDPAGTHLLDSSNPAHRLSFNVPAINAGSTCAEATFDVDVFTTGHATITSGLFRNCMGTNAAVNCTVTAVGTRFPWTVTPLSTTNVTIDGVHVDAFFENTPGNATACALPGNVTLTGNLTGGTVDNATHEIAFNGAAGLTAHIAPLAMSLPATVTGTLRDTQQTLTFTG